MPRNPEIRSVIVDEKGRLTSDVICPRCRYNLRGVQQDGACPECGIDVKKAMALCDSRRWTRLQIVLSTLAIAYGVLLPIVNSVAQQHEYYFTTILESQLVFTGFVVVWIFGGLACLIALKIAASNRIYTRIFSLIMAAVLAETVIALGMIAMWWVKYLTV